MTTDRTYLMAGSIAPRLNELLPPTATVLEADLDTDRDMVHVRVVSGRAELYFGITDGVIVSTVENDGYTSPQKVFSISAFMSDTTWAQTVADYITAEVNHFTACNRPRPTINDLAKSQAESEQGWTLA
jgi:hypothetical protein